MKWWDLEKSGLVQLIVSLGGDIMHQPFETPALPTLGMVGTLVWVWKSVKFPDTGAKILSEVPANWYSAEQTKVPCVESAVTAFLKSSHHTLSPHLC